MLAKKWKQLPLNKNEIDSLEEEKNDEMKNEEIIIINMGNDSDSEPENKEDINELERQSHYENNSKNNLKYSKIKPQPLIYVDPNSLDMTNYIVEKKPKPYYYNKDLYDIEDIINKYSPKYSKDYNSQKKNQEKTYQINMVTNIDEAKNKFKINDIINSYINNKHISRTERNNFSNNNSFYLKNSQKENTYYNYGPIYGYERNKELKNQIISDINEYKTLNPYNTLQNRKTYYMSPKDNNIKPTKIANESTLINKSDIRKEYPNLYFFNDYKNNIIKKINKNNTIPTKNNNSTNINSTFKIKKFYLVERPNTKKKNEDIRSATFNLEKKLDYLNSSINRKDKDNNNDNKSNKRKNNSMIDLKNDDRIINEYNHNYSNSFLLNNYIKKANEPKDYEIKEIDNLLQHYPSYSKSNNFSGYSSFTKLNYINH